MCISGCSSSGGLAGETENAELTLAIANNRIIASSTVATKVGSLPWTRSLYNSYLNMDLTFETVYVNKSLIISVEDVTNGVTLGSATISASGFTRLPLLLPTSDARLELRVSKDVIGATSPTIDGAVLNLY